MDVSMEKQEDDNISVTLSAHTFVSDSTASVQDLPCLAICQNEEAAPEKKPEPSWQPQALVQPIPNSAPNLNGSTTELKPFRCCITADRLNQLRKKVEDAIREKKTFTIKGGFQYIRSSLLQRGWIEKIDFKVPYRNPTISNPPSMDEVCCNLPPKQEWESAASHLAKCEKMIISRLLQYHEVDFYWNMRKDSHEWQQRMNKGKIINRFSRSLFTSKEGLCLLLHQMYWHTEPGVAFMRFPRCYTINFADHCGAFIEDFRMTSCISLLKWLTTEIQHAGGLTLCSPDGKISINTIQFAIDRCNEFVATQKHQDLDKDFHKVWDHEWDQFLSHFRGLVHNGEPFEESGLYSLYGFESNAKVALKNIIPFWPQFDLDGVKNIWIMKPGNKCRGRDITLIKDSSHVIRAMNHKLKYVVQKYIERPLLIYKTKFDIRQWFLVTSVQPLAIWMYRDCYLRFSSQQFSLENFHESVHLTNHAVQHKYPNQERDKSLPDDNMWDNHTFKAYLRQIGQAEKWFKVIYPGMRECIIGAMLASQDTMDRRPNTFELYGADFMIAENFTPWLIEINSCPAMGPTTSVTARMCPQCFEDVIKVVIDRRKDPKSDTGLFELIYRQNLPQTPAYLGMSLSVRGKKIFKKKNSAKQKNEKKDSIEHKHKVCRSMKPKINLESMIKSYNGPVIGNLIEELHDTLFKNTIEDIERILPPAPQVSLMSTRVAPQRNAKHLSVLPPQSCSATSTRGPTDTTVTKRKIINSKFVFDRKSSTRERSSSRLTEQPRLSNMLSHQPRVPGCDLSKAPNTTPNWEQNTASILNFKKSTLTNLSITTVLPDVDQKTNNTMCQNLNLSLLTVGMGYHKNSAPLGKPLSNNSNKEELLLPLGSSRKTVENCC